MFFDVVPMFRSVDDLRRRASSILPRQTEGLLQIAHGVDPFTEDAVVFVQVDGVETDFSRISQSISMKRSAAR